MIFDPFKYNGFEQHVACVGENGGTTDSGILEGYKDAAFILFDNIINHNGCEDQLIYPLFYCCRHSVELGLKIILNLIIVIKSIKKENISQYQIIIKKQKTHNIKILNDLIKDIVDTDPRISQLYVKIEPYLQTYYFDKQGDAFKYESNTCGDLLMLKYNISQISIDVLKEQYTSLIEDLVHLVRKLNSFEKEYKLGTFTKKLSRNQIEQISLELSAYDKWKTGIIKSEKEVIKNKYNISSHEFDKAVNIIKNNMQFAFNIGLEVKYKQLTDLAILKYAECVFDIDIKYNKIEITFKQAGTNGLETLEKLKILSKKKEKWVKQIEYDNLLILTTFYEIGKSYDFYCEDIEYIYQNLYRNDDFGLLTKICSYNACEYILYGMYRSGQITYFKKLKEQLSNCGIFMDKNSYKNTNYMNNY